MTLTNRDRIKQKLAAISKNVSEIQTLMAKEEAKTDKANKVVPGSLAAAVKKLSNQGMSQRQIAAKLGIGHMVANSILKGFQPAEKFGAKRKPKP
ncbi:MAG: hypothetical protein IKE69_05865 [Thermoguttaceae bacterium]|nr:hypothetical protein [Thermoguttaceae bacterium]